jgi:hypothetical protein
MYWGTATSSLWDGGSGSGAQGLLTTVTDPVGGHNSLSERTAKILISRSAGGRPGGQGAEPPFVK